ncbi:MAG: AIR synthase-related protein, partial [Candidatus Gottesmanbacteria bacterium]|nr:AIR synthase-related protein [Candidatus Gottesmanbacteria bacterium]
MVTRIEITSTVLDPRVRLLTAHLGSLGYKIRVVSVTDVYTIDKQLDKKQISTITSMLTNPVVQRSDYIYAISPSKFDWAIEIGYLPGVTDNVANTVREMVTDRLHSTFRGTENIYTSIVYFVKGKLSESTIRNIADELYNPLIQRAGIKSQKIFVREKGMDRVIPRVMLSGPSEAETVNLTISDTELAAIGKSGIPNADGTRRGPLALSLSSMKEIAKYFAKKKRKPTDVELESIAQTWSEHCKHIIFNSPIDDIQEGLFLRYIKRATDVIRAGKGTNDFCVSVFSDNSGAIRLDRTYLLTHKVETHNSPSALDPYGGALTGIVGVNRDTIGFGLGAKPILNTYGFCLADPKIDVPIYKGSGKTCPMLSSRRIFDGVVAGVNSGGNCSGIPTPQGFLYVDPRYRGKPLVFVGTVGLIPEKMKGRKMYVKKARPGDYIVMVGGRVGLDGIHGATFSSEALSTGSPATAVQIGDPITQKKLSDAIVKEARDLALYTSITDNGAGGLSCSVAEMAKESGGCVVDLEKVPLKYPGLAPWQIWISESQERMTLSVPKKSWKRFSSLMKDRGVEATVIGTFIRSGKCVVQYKNKTVMDVDMQFLHDGFPRAHLHSKPVIRKHPEPAYKEKLNYTAGFLQLIGRKNIAGISFLAQQ